MNDTPTPGYADQSRKRWVFRVIGVLSMTTALVLIGVAIADFMGAFNAADTDPMAMDEPDLIWLFFVALPFFLVGGACLQAGFVGAVARYGAGEVAPALRDTVGYLGGTEQGRAPVAGGREPAAGPFCRACGTRNDADARFCDSCGASLA